MYAAYAPFSLQNVDEIGLALIPVSGKNSGDFVNNDGNVLQLLQMHMQQANFAWHDLSNIMQVARYITIFSAG